MNPAVGRLIWTAAAAAAAAIGNAVVNKMANTKKKIPVICPNCGRHYGEVDIDVFDRLYRGKTMCCETCKKDFTI